MIFWYGNEEVAGLLSLSEWRFQKALRMSNHGWYILISTHSAVKKQTGYPLIQQK